MTPQELRDRTKKFAVNVLEFAKTSISSDPIDQEIGKQLTRAAGATAAGYRATCRARSRKDFIYKLGNIIEEVDEAALWLEVLVESEIVPGRLVQPLWQEADELTRIFVKSRQTARNRRFDPDKLFVS